MQVQSTHHQCFPPDEHTPLKEKFDGLSPDKNSFEVHLKFLILTNVLGFFEEVEVVPQPADTLTCHGHHPLKGKGHRFVLAKLIGHCSQ